MSWITSPETMAVWMVSAAIVAIFLALVLASRRTATAWWGAGLLASIAWWQGLYAAELTATAPETKLLWDQLQFLGIGSLGVTWLAYAAHTAGRSGWITRGRASALFVVPVALTLLALTDPFHGLVWSSMELVDMGGTLVRVEEEGPAALVAALYTYLLLLAGAVLLGVAMVRDPGRRWPGLWLLVGLAVPSAAYLLEATEALGPNTLDLAPLGLAISSLLVSWVIFSASGRVMFATVGAAALQTTRELVFLLDDADRVLHLNPAAVELTGLDVDRARGLALVEVWPRWGDLDRGDFGAGSTEVEVSHGGERHWYAIGRTPQLTPEAGPSGSVVVVRDITALRRAERVLAQSEARFRLLFESAPDGFLILGADGVVEDCNRGAEDLLGSDREELLGRTLADCGAFSPDADLRQLLEPRPGGPAELEIRGERLAEVCAFSVHSGDDDLVLVVLRDVTARREREEAASRAREARAVRAILESSPDPIILVDPDGGVLDCSSAAVEVLGLPDHDALTGRCFVDYVAGRDRARVLEALQVASGGLVRGVEASLVPADGEHVAVDLSFGALQGRPEDPPGVVVVAKDARERRVLSAQIAQTDRLASVGLLAAGVAHGINNPLAYVHGNLEHLRELLSDVPRALECVEDCLDGTERIRAIVRDLQPYTRAQEEDLSPVDLEAILDQTIHLTSNELAVRGVLHRDFASVPTVRGSRPRLGQVFLNLVLNALQAMDGRDVSHVLTIRTRRDGHEVVVEIKDTGPGIAPEDLPRVFDPYFSTRDPSKGSGLGLWICRNVVEQCGGTIELVSEPRRGATARVRLPVMVEERPGELERPPPAEPPVVRPRILVVDDEPMVRRVLERRLRRDHDVALASSGSEAQEMLRSGARFHMVLCDLLMPGLSGPDLHAWILEHVPDLANRMVFMTGGAFTREAEEFLRSLSTPHLAKPLDMATLEELARRLATGDP